MNKLILILILICLFVSASLASCTGVRQIECPSADWAVIGFEDGEAGKPVSAIGGYQEICSEQGAAMDINAYNTGHEEGVRAYCQPENGYELGKNSLEYTVACPADLSDAFRERYREGLRFYPFYRSIGELQMTITGNTATIGKLQTAISSDYIRMDSPNITYSERNQIRLNIESMKSHVRNYELANQRLELDLSEVSIQLQELRAR